MKRKIWGQVAHSVLGRNSRKSIGHASIFSFASPERQKSIFAEPFSSDDLVERLDRCGIRCFPGPTEVERHTIGRCPLIQNLGSELAHLIRWIALSGPVDFSVVNGWCQASTVEPELDSEQAFGISVPSGTTEPARLRAVVRMR